MNAAAFPLRVGDFVNLIWPWPNARPLGQHEGRAEVTCVVPCGEVPDMSNAEVANAFEAFGASSSHLQAQSVDRYALKFDNGDIVIWDDFEHLRSFVKTVTENGQVHADVAQT